MKLKITIYSLFFSLLVTLAACDVNAIFKDSSGNELALLRLDMPRYPASYHFWFFENGAPLTEDITVVLDGANDDDIVTDAGKTNYSYNVEGAWLDLYLKPSVKFDTKKFVSFTVKGRWNGSKMVLPQVVHHREGGRKDIFMDVVTLPDVAKESIPEPLTIRGEGGIVLKPLADLSGYMMGLGYRYLNLYRADVSGKYYVENRTLASGDTFGIYSLNDSFLLSPPTEIDIKEAGEYFFTVMRPQNSKPSSLRFRVNSTESHWAQFEYMIRMENITYRGMFSGVMPFDQTIENIYTNPLSREAQITIIPRGVAEVDQDSFTLTDLATTSTLTLNARIKPTENLRKYDFSIMVRCPSDRRVAYAVSKSFKYAVGTKNTKALRIWQNAELATGKTVLYLEPDTRYTFGVSINNVWYYYDFTTSARDVTNIINGENKISKYTLTPRSIAIEVENEEFCLI